MAAAAAVAPRSITRSSRAWSSTAATTARRRPTPNAAARGLGAQASPADPARSLTATACRPMTTTTAAPSLRRTAAPRLLPLMQGFQTSAPARTTAPSRIHACIFPFAPVAPYDPYARPTAASERDKLVVVVAADPANVAHAPLTESDGFFDDGIPLALAHAMEDGCGLAPPPSGMLPPDLGTGAAAARPAKAV